MGRDSNDEHAAAMRRFFDGLPHIPWQANVGQPSPRDAEVFRFYSWETWPGPEDPGTEMLCTYLAETTICPAVNQIELSPRVTWPDQLAYGRAHAIATVA